MNTYIKEELEKLIFVDKLSYEEIGRQYGVTGINIKRAALRRGIKLESRKNKNNFKLCIICNNICKKGSKKCCSYECSITYSKIKKYEIYLNDQEKYENISDYKIRSFKYKILEEQNCKCDICKTINVWNNKPLMFILDHIDGNAYNNRRNNLRLICSNCDSQLETYKSKNKNSARKKRYLLNYKNQSKT